MNKLMMSVGLSVLTLSAFAGKFDKFPDWAKTVLEQTDFSQCPEDADSWILLHDVDLEMASNGKLQVRRKLVRFVARDRGAEYGAYYVVFGDEQEVKVKTIKGWHLGSSGKIDKLNKKDVVTLGDSDSSSLNRSTTTLAYFDDVSKGSLIAFESLEIKDSFFPRYPFSVLTPEPIKEMRIKISSKDPNMAPKLVASGFEDWSIEAESGPQSLVLRQIPAQESEFYSPDFMEAYPYVVASFAGVKVRHLQSWDAFAAWYSGVFHQAAGSAGNSQPTASLDKVSQMVNQVTDTISYRQRYLSPGRGWLPASGPEVNRRAYGDCKDMVACLAYAGSKQQVRVQPVLASIGDGFRPTEAFDPGPIFDHLIGAVALEKSLGLPAEVDVAGKPYLLVDPTSNHTEFGYLPAYYRNRQVMLCLEDRAVWIAVPESALEPESVKMELSGLLNENFTLAGSLNITEQGNALGIRTVSREENPRTLEGFVRRRLDLPGFLDMKMVNLEVLEAGKVSLIYQVRWPSFLMRDAGGLRLPFAIVDRPKRGFARQGEAREMPIYFGARPKTEWHVQVRCKTPTMPTLEEANYEDVLRSYQWTASGGEQLIIRYQTEAREVFYAKDALEEAEKQWKAYRKAHNTFALSGAILTTP